ncbi:MAG TPA: 1-acyl-sn-glycerol-3-phosphate acyltransferase [Gemmataceae bacterium]|jgi:glycerol-3-phosphate O-acyltransferase/dihydroxyacetone phosphate acyltransferase|nr:1-acyl-sn-glycerol-3-phosphate acyltransferase [Gemmataceae bacterium]
MLYPLFRLLARLMLRLFFRRIEVEGRSEVPGAGPVLFVPNHTNALVDPLLLVVSLQRRVTLTAKNVLGKNPLLGLLLHGLGAVTFHRRQDVGKGADRRQNVRALERCRQVLAQGGALCIFPEGVSHSDPQMRPFQSGAAHIALDYVLKDGNPSSLQVIPVGLLYTEKDRFRSEICLRYGPALDVGAWLKEHPGATSQALTEEIRRRVEYVTLNYESRRETLILTWGAQIVATGGMPPSPLGWKARPVAEWFALLRRLQEGYRLLQESRPADVEAVVQRIRRYRSELKRLGIDPGEVYLPVHLGKALFFTLRETELLLIGAPLALYGAVNHLGPYLVVKAIAKAMSTDKDHWATNVVYPGFLVFPFFYVVQIGAAWIFLPVPWAVLYTLSVPYSAAVALLYGDRIRASWRRCKTFLFLWRHPDRQQELAQEGREIIAAIRRLGEQL